MDMSVNGIMMNITRLAYGRYSVEERAHAYEKFMLFDGYNEYFYITGESPLSTQYISELASEYLGETVVFSGARVELTFVLNLVVVKESNFDGINRVAGSEISLDVEELNAYVRAKKTEEEAIRLNIELFRYGTTKKEKRVKL